MCKERFPSHMRSKLQPRGDGLLLVLERITDNIYKMNLLVEYAISDTLNIFYLFLFDVSDDLRLNPFKKRMCNANQLTTSRDPLEMLSEPIIRLRVSKLKEALNGLIHNI
jgi:hypothetical protein